MIAEGLADDPLDSITIDCPGDVTLRHRDPQARDACGVRCEEDAEMFRTESQAGSEQAEVQCTPAKPGFSGKAVDMPMPVSGVLYLWRGVI